MHAACLVGFNVDSVADKGVVGKPNTVTKLEDMARRFPIGPLRLAPCGVSLTQLATVAFAPRVYVCIGNMLLVPNRRLWGSHLNLSAIIRDHFVARKAVVYSGHEFQRKWHHLFFCVETILEPPFFLRWKRF